VHKAAKVGSYDVYGAQENGSGCVVFDCLVLPTVHSCNVVHFQKNMATLQDVGNGQER
jgi:hypothetical protein